MQHLMTMAPPSEEWMEYIRDFRNSFVQAGEKHIHGAEGLIHFDDAGEWVRKMRKQHSNIILCSYMHDAMVGVIRLTPHPTQEQVTNGSLNVGQSICPGWRGLGFGTKQLRMGLSILRQMGIQSPMCSVYMDNKASMTTVERTGGTLICKDGDSFVYQWLLD